MKPIYICLHHTAVSYDKNPDQFDANNNYHKKLWNFKSSLGFYLGYNYEISKTGILRKARQDGETTAACYQSGMNSGKCIHISLDGNFDQEKPEPEQIFRLRDLLKELVKKYDIKKENIVFHRDYATKTCPGNNVELGFIKSLAFPEVLEENENAIKNQIIKAVQDLLALVRKI